MEKLLKIPYAVFNDWNLLQQFLDKRGNPRYELVGNINLRERKDIFDIGNLVRVDGHINLSFSSLQSLRALEYVSGNLRLYNTPIQSLGNLKYVGGNLQLYNAQIQSLGNLEYVGFDLILQNTPIQSLGNLQYVGDTIYLSRNHQIPEEQLTKFKIEYD